LVVYEEEKNILVSWYSQTSSFSPTNSTLVFTKTIDLL